MTRQPIDAALYCIVCGIIFTLIALLPFIFSDREIIALWLALAMVMYMAALVMMLVKHWAYLGWRSRR